jgi:hypothetical protein
MWTREKERERNIRQCKRRYFFVVSISTYGHISPIYLPITDLVIRWQIYRKLRETRNRPTSEMVGEEKNGDLAWLLVGALIGK